MNLTIEIPDAQQAVLAAKAREQGVSAEQYASRVLRDDLVGVERSEENPVARAPEALGTAASIILSCMESVPAEVMASMPADGASQHDHYIYGWPKKEA